MVDLAIMLSGHISVPLFPNQSVKAANHVLKECDVSLMFVGECGQEQKLQNGIRQNVTLSGHARLFDSGRPQFSANSVRRLVLC